MKNLRKIYDCETTGEIKDYIASRLNIDAKFVHIDEKDHIYIGRVRRKDLVLERSRHRVQKMENLPWIILYQKS